MHENGLVGTFWRLRWAKADEKARLFVVLGRDKTRDKHQYFLLDVERKLGFWGTPSGWGDEFRVWFPGDSLRSMDPARDA